MSNVHCQTGLRLYQSPTIRQVSAWAPGRFRVRACVISVQLGVDSVFRRVERRPTWGTCAGLILLSESATATSTKRGGQDLIGGLDVRINRNHFGRQVESFEADLDLPFLQAVEGETIGTNKLPFRSVFIRAPVVEKILTSAPGAQDKEEGLGENGDTIVAPQRESEGEVVEQSQQLQGTGAVEVMARLPGRAKRLPDKEVSARVTGDEGDIVAVKQGNVFGTAFHPELTGDARIHVWWLDQVRRAIKRPKMNVGTM